MPASGSGEWQSLTRLDKPQHAPPRPASGQFAAQHATPRSRTTAPPQAAPAALGYPPSAPDPDLDGPTGPNHGARPGAFIAPGSHAGPITNGSQLRPVAPHLDPRVAGLADVVRKRNWYGFGTRAPEPLQNPTSDALRAPILTPRRVAIVGLKGGVGKTTSSILMARTFARERREPILLLDADQTYGSLLLRMGVVPLASAHDLARMGDPGSIQVLRGSISRTDDGVWVVPSGHDPAQSAAFDERTYVNSVRAIYRYFPISVTDCGTGLGGVLMERIATASHTLVIATSPSLDGVLASHNALRWLVSSGKAELAKRSVVVISNVPEMPVLDMAETRARLEPLCHAVITIPADPSIAPGGVIDYDRLSPATRDAAADLASVTLASAFSAP